MSYSLNEIEALSKKAARGAGFSWGMAEEAGRALRWLSSFGLAGPAQFADMLTRQDGRNRADFAPIVAENVLSAAGLMCPIAAGAALCDGADRIAGKGISLKQVAYPLLVLPFVASASIHLRRPIEVVWDEVSVRIDAEGILVSDPAKQLRAVAADSVEVRIVTAKAKPTAKPSFRGEIVPEVWEILMAFAHRTYAPATDESRLLGAGAGVADND